MVNAFFGIPTDPNTLFKFAKLVWLLETARADKYQNVVIDVEPTAGLGRLLTTAQMTVRCLRNLHNKGKFSLAALGLAWPDVSNYLRGEYIKQAEKYAERLERAVAALEAAKFFLVCTPEAVPMRQMFQVEQLVERFGGHASGYVVNNHRGEVAEEQILLAVEDENCPVAVIEHDSNLQTVTTGELRRLLCQIGKEIERALPLREEAVPAQ
jgi:anion-transporting  ArsA/GET3 family ATPase